MTKLNLMYAVASILGFQMGDSFVIDGFTSITGGNRVYTFTENGIVYKDSHGEINKDSILCNLLRGTIPFSFVRKYIPMRNNSGTGYMNIVAHMLNLKLYEPFKIGDKTYRLTDNGLYLTDKDNNDIPQDAVLAKMLRGVIKHD